MTYRFKSKATGDLLMLDPDGRRLLEIVGKEPRAAGIILHEEMAAAVKALEAAVKGDEAAPGHAVRDTDEEPPGQEPVSLRQRAMPFIDMLRRCGAEGVEIVWSR